MLRVGVSGVASIMAILVGAMGMLISACSEGSLVAVRNTYIEPFATVEIGEHITEHVAVDEVTPYFLVPSGMVTIRAITESSLLFQTFIHVGEPNAYILRVDRNGDITRE